MPAGAPPMPRSSPSAVAQAIMGIPSDRRFLRAGPESLLATCFPVVPGQAGYFKRRRRLAPRSLSGSFSSFAEQSPGFYDDLLLIDSTPVECARSRETVLRSALSDLCDYGYCAAVTPATSGGCACTPSSPRTALPGRYRSPRPSGMNGRWASNSLGAAGAREGRSSFADKGYAGEEFASAVKELRGHRWSGPSAKTSREKALTLLRFANGSNPSSAPARTSSPWNATAPAPLRASKSASCSAFLCLAACISLNYQLGRPSRALVDYYA